jgi:rhamnosyl/mannosyltransferase
MTTLGSSWPESNHRSEPVPRSADVSLLDPGRETREGGHSSLRIVHLGKYYHPAHGGIERSVRTLAHGQAALGCTVRVVCMDHEQGRANRIEHDGPVEVVRLRRTTSFGKLDHCPDLARLIRQCEADLFHLHTPNPSMILGLLLAGERRPLVISHYSDVIKQRLRRLIFSPIERACYNRARLLLSVSSAYVAGSAILRRYPERLAVLPIGLDLAAYLDPAPEVVAHGALLRRSYGGGPLWFSCGRLVYYKGLETAIEALRFVPGTLLIGGDGPARPKLQRLAARRKLVDRVRFLGRIPGDDELIAHYLAADAFWFPSNARSEAYGLVQVEAMACGRPVINAAIPHSGVAWVSRHGETGLTVPVNDPAALAAAAQRLLDEPSLRDRLAAGARARAIAEFQAETTARRSIALYSSMLAEAGNQRGQPGPTVGRPG